MFFIKKELLKNGYIVILGMLMTALVFSVSMVLFSLSPSIKDNHLNELIRQNPHGVQIELSRRNFDRFVEIPKSDAYQFSVSTINRIAIFNDEDDMVNNSYIDFIDNQFVLIQYQGAFIQRLQEFPLFIEREFTFIEKNNDLPQEPISFYPIYLSEAFAAYLDVELDDEIRFGFYDNQEKLMNENSLIPLKVYGIFESHLGKYEHIHFLVMTPELNLMYQPFKTLFTPFLIINDMSMTYTIYHELEQKGIIFTGIFGFSDYLSMNENMSYVFLVLSMLMLILGTLLLLHITFLIIRNRMPWISMVKSLGLSSKSIVLIYVVLMQIMLLCACLLSLGFAYLINQRIQDLAMDILNYYFLNEVNTNHFLSIYLISFVLVSLLSFFIYRFIKKHSAFELNRVKI